MKKKKQTRDLRHPCSLHKAVLFAGPSSLQFFPALAGGGLVQVLVKVLTPPPHVTLHLEIVQLVYPPFTAVKEIKRLFKISTYKNKPLVQFVTKGRLPVITMEKTHLGRVVMR